MKRTYVVTGAASGIGAATKRYVEERGGRVITCDLREADVIADLTTVVGRAALIEGVTRLAEGHVDAIVANAGGGPPETSPSLNFFGAVATLEALRPLLNTSPAPRAVAVSSVAALPPPIPTLVEACLKMDEAAATAAALDRIAAVKHMPVGANAPPLDVEAGLSVYGSVKRALQLWCRRAAPTSAWAGAAIPLNVIALGFLTRRRPRMSYRVPPPARRCRGSRRCAVHTRGDPKKLRPRCSGA
jgi:NAD(P)-dependent dehydrogenase (short-subunit alcohol dehydrogenase family)